MKLHEVLKAKIDFEVTKHTPSMYVAKATIGGREIAVGLTKDQQLSTQAFKGKDTWVLIFTEQSQGSNIRTTKLTGSGKAFEVLSFVKAALEQFVELYKPSVIVFTSDSDNARSSLYTKILKKADLHGYQWQRQRLTNEEDHFTLMRIDHEIDTDLTSKGVSGDHRLGAGPI